MNFIEDLNLLMKSEEFSEAGKNLCDNIISALTGDLLAARDILKFLKKSPMLIPQYIFWEKFMEFLDGVFYDDESIRKMSEIFANNEEKEEFAYRILNIIEEIDSKAKVKFLINLTRALLGSFISKSDYYRLGNVLSKTLYEDLLYLNKNIKKRRLKNNINIEFLKQTGLITQTIISENEDGSGAEFEFTSVAHMLDKFALDYENTDKYDYSALTTKLNEQSVLNTSVNKVTAVFG